MSSIRGLKREFEFHNKKLHNFRKVYKTHNTNLGGGGLPSRRKERDKKVNQVRKRGKENFTLKSTRFPENWEEGHLRNVSEGRKGDLFESLTIPVRDKTHGVERQNRGDTRISDLVRIRGNARKTTVLFTKEGKKTRKKSWKLSFLTKALELGA